MNSKFFATAVSICCLLLALNLDAQETEMLIAKGDSAFKAFNNREALNYYSQVLKIDSSHYEAAWKISRAYVDVGETIDDDETRKEAYKRAQDYAQKAVNINPEGAKGYLYLSVAIGRVALDAGKKEQVQLSKDVKAAVDKALALDPTDDIAWHVLGRWHRKMATLNWIQKNFANMFLGGVPKEASVDSSAACFRRAIELNPGHINHHLELAFTYEELDRKDKAILEYEKVVELPKTDADDDEYKKQARERLKKLK
ncbi:MAG: tetratricopeptide repeat protein [Calditrichaeota bacterium]|nr:tetratricopeptide repeat protein [Calditrichota bacterium]